MHEASPLPPPCSTWCCVHWRSFPRGTRPSRQQAACSKSLLRQGWSTTRTATMPSLRLASGPKRYTAGEPYIPLNNLPSYVVLFAAPCKLYPLSLYPHPIVFSVQLAAVQSLVGYMEEGVASPGKAPPPGPNSDTWDLLLHAYLAENDCDGLLVALQKAKSKGVSSGMTNCTSGCRAFCLFPTPSARRDHRSISVFPPRARLMSWPCSWATGLRPVNCGTRWMTGRTSTRRGIPPIPRRGIPLNEGMPMV